MDKEHVKGFLDFGRLFRYLRKQKPPKERGEDKVSKSEVNEKTSTPTKESVK